MSKELNIASLKNIVREALAEDIGSGDATTLAIVAEEQLLDATIRTREECTIAGLPVVDAVFAEIDAAVVVRALHTDGSRCPAGSVIATVEGPARAILTGERTALNFLQRLSGIATASAAYVAAVGNTTTRILDTRKTTPGLRQLEKYAVAMGGADNHRFGLYDQVMIKDNHRQLAALDGPGGIHRAVTACRTHSPELTVEVEADTLDDVREALDAGADIILLDNMTTPEIVAAVALRDEHRTQTLLEASGGITLEHVPEIARTGVDFISVGALTHSVRAIDIGLDIERHDRYPE